MSNFLVVCIILGCLCIADTECSYSKRDAGNHWGYTAANGPSTWGGVCKTGKKQSPIDLELGTAALKKFLPFTFDDNYSRVQKFLAKNNGHTVQVTLEEDINRPSFSGGGLRDKFIFEQLHFHWESEHEFDGKRADLEMHIVHYNAKYGSFGEAVTKNDGIAVLGVVFEESDEQDYMIEEFLDYILTESANEGHPPHPASPDNKLPSGKQSGESSGYFRLRNLLPKTVSRFFRYMGSLTTPGCGEVVEWTVFVNRLPVSKKALEAFRKLHDHDGNLLTKNYRPPQKLYGRVVYIQMEDDDVANKDISRRSSNGGGFKMLSPLLNAAIVGRVLSLIH